MFKSRSHVSTESKYTKIRAEVIEAANKLVPVQFQPAVTYSLITRKALFEQRSWHGTYGRRVDWDWEKDDYGYNHFLYQEPKRFEMALWWREMKLCALALGQPTWSGSRLRVDFMEAAPGDNPLKGEIFRFIELAAILYARRIDAHEVRLMKPVNSDVVSYYNSQGYQYDRRGNFCYKVLR
ncbi:conserved hypothetical protein [Hahella chejuensis KCTC 2396]|uniref:N-acetyltransferase domain-containing protein n=1 Tax=Hahella chejuensis (strain KCTC 2396) TaxID=349521 RepID=Q2SI74_HAHCH|nr:hypothetical protein [Hahella chejuensis]ABC29650.1 conserved hypothetical protein [Hahella chejuensis KCTC 2396]